MSAQPKNEDRTRVKVVQIKFVAMHITNQKCIFDILTVYI